MVVQGRAWYRVAASAAFGLVACGGPVEETLLDELRIVAMVPDYPEVGPGESVRVETWTADPASAGYDLLVWTCTAPGPPGTPCLEGASPTSSFAVVVRGGAPPSTLHQVPAAIQGLLADTPELRVGLRALACVPGSCEVMDEVEAAGDQPPSEDLAAALADLSAVLVDEPITGVAAAQRSLVVSSRPPESRNQNPVVSGPSEVLEAAIGASASIRLEVEDTSAAVFAYGYALAGGFGAAEVQVLNGTADLEWFAPEESSETLIPLFVVVQDEAGGSTVWEGAGRVGQNLD